MSYAPKAQVARAFLSRAYNDLDVYVEDETCHNMYVRLINRILDGAARITSVFPLGGRAPLLAACAADQDEGGRKRVYLLDADLDLLRGQPVPQMKRLHRLSAYCIENLVLSEAALLEVALESSPNKPRERLEGELQLRARAAGAESLLLPLYVTYAVAAELRVTVQTTGYSVIRLCRNPSDPSSLCPRMIRSRIRQVVAAVYGAKGRAEYLRAKRQVVAHLSTWQGPRRHLVSGKSCWLPLALSLLKSTVGFRDSADSLKVRLAAYCELDAALGRALRNAATAA